MIFLSLTMNYLNRLILGSVTFAALFFASQFAKADITRVACVGDSITYGYGLHDRQNDAYPVWLGKWLGTNYNVRNFGVNSTTLLHRANFPYIKQRAYTNALEFKADIVIINLGANDSKRPHAEGFETAKALNNWQYKTNFVSDYEDLIASFRKTNPAMKIYICFPTPDFPGRWGINDQTIREEMIPMIRTVAKDTGTTIIDLHSAMEGKGDLFPDAVHPNDEGAKLMAAAVFKSLTGHAPPE